MKRSIFARWLPLVAALLVVVSCDGIFNDDDGDGGGDQIPEVYKEFYNYPAGRSNTNGLLTIKNSANAKVLLFTDSVSASNYVGTVEGLNSIKVKLPEEKFYTIVAVDKANYEDKKEQASQFSDLTYYSNRQPYEMTVRPDDMYGAGKWIISNTTDYWVSMRKVDGSGGNWAVVAPKALRTEVPIPIGSNFDFIPHFYKELKHNGKVIALVESDAISEANTVTTSEQYPTFNTSIGNTLQPPSPNLNPAIFLTNSSDKTVRVYSGQNNQLSPSGQPGLDFAMGSGWDQMFTDGISPGSNTNAINFAALGWEPPRVYVSQDVTMQKDKVYRIVLSGNSTQGYSTSVQEEDGSEYFN
jgi:hypothetical protein